MRPGAAAGRSPSALSELGGGGARSRAEQGVVIRLSADAQKILGGREGQDQERPPAGRSGGDSDAAGEVISGSGLRAPAQGAVLPAGTSDGSSQTGGDRGSQPGGDKAAAGKAGGAQPAGDKPAVGQARKLTAEDKQLVTRLAARDTAVRAHEAAHQAAASGLGGGASFTYETGPDGRNYAVGGEVPVSLRPGRTPDETIANAQTVRSAALAPADPSAQDLAVAAEASQMEAEARQEKVHDNTDVREPGQAGNRSGAVGARGEGRAEPASPATGKPRGDAKSEAAESPRERDVERDQVMVFSALKAERGGVEGGHRHLASGGSCAICSRAAARYA